MKLSVRTFWILCASSWGSRAARKWCAAGRLLPLANLIRDEPGKPFRGSTFIDVVNSCVCRPGSVSAVALRTCHCLGQDTLMSLQPGCSSWHSATAHRHPRTRVLGWKGHVWMSAGCVLCSPWQRSAPLTCPAAQPGPRCSHSISAGGRRKIIPFSRKPERGGAEGTPGGTTMPHMQPSSQWPWGLLRQGQPSI